MGVYLELLNFDKLFAANPVTPVIINDIPVVTEEQTQFLDNLVFKRFDTDLLSNVPSCDCGETTRAYRIGLRCPSCGTLVKDQLDQDLTPLVWFRRPQDIKSLMNPIALMMLIEHFEKNNFSLIEWLLNTDYVSSAKRPVYLDALIASGIKRGYNNFIENIDSYLDILFEIKFFRVKKGRRDPLYDLMKKSLVDNTLLCSYLPLVNKSLLIIEETKTGKWVDPITIDIIDIVRTIQNIDSPIMGYTSRQKQNRIAKVVVALARYYTATINEIMDGKPGLFRKHVFATRNDFSARCVISSLTTAHRYDELLIPWGAAVTMLKMHLMNKLIRRGYTVNHATSLLHFSVYRFHPLIRQLFDEIFNEAPDNKLYCLWQRNPSLTRTSLQRVGITGVKDDVSDSTISMSILAVKGFNADFDGDQMNLTLCLDNTSAQQCEPLAPHKNILDIHNPREFSGIAGIPKQVVGTIANWLEYKEDEPLTTEQLMFMNTLEGECNAGIYGR